MCPHNPDTNPDTSDDHAEPGTPAGEEQPGVVVPLPRRAERAGVTVERIDTEPMTADEYRLAVTTLAALINQWKHPDKNPYHDGKTPHDTPIFPSPQGTVEGQ